MNQVTEALTIAMADWVSMAVQQLDQERMDVFNRCVATEGADIRVVVCLREGAVLLEATNMVAGTRFELFREDVEPLRPADYVGHQGQSGRQSDITLRIKEVDMRYINSIPRKLPEGRVLVHNRVRPARPLGTGGFRAWTQIKDDTIEPCRCNFAGHPNAKLHKHYKVKLDV